jgi:hypothetical protein
MVAKNLIPRKADDIKLDKRHTVGYKPARQIMSRSLVVVLISKLLLLGWS